MSSISFAEEPYKYKKQVLLKLQEKTEIAMTELEAAAGKCYEEQKASSLSIAHFKDINISHKEMMTALFYFSAKADLECITEIKFKNLAYSLLKYQRTLKSYNESLKPLPYVHFSSGTDEELEIRYTELPLKYRTALEKILELSKPFDSGKILKQIEFEIYGITPKDIYY
jgi:hypothetical protein